MLLEPTDRGPYCSAGDFYIDPWEPVDRALITHAHSDHARPGSRRYLTAQAGEMLLRARLGPEAAIEGVEYGEAIHLDGVRVSFHPAGHILGSAQIRIEQAGQVWVVSGDYKLDPDPTCAPFEPIRCHTFVTESTFGLPIYRWPKPAEVMAEINAWWRANQEAGKASVLFAYPLGKAQRVLAGIDHSIGPIVCHAAVERMNRIYGLHPPEHSAKPAPLFIAPLFVKAGYRSSSTAWASGWMRIRGTRRRRALDRGFVLSDHADWPGLLAAIEATGAERVLVTHGYRGALVRWLTEKGLDARAIATRFEGELEE